MYQVKKSTILALRGVEKLLRFFVIDYVPSEGHIHIVDIFGIILDEIEEYNKKEETTLKIPMYYCVECGERILSPDVSKYREAVQCANCGQLFCKVHTHIHEGERRCGRCSNDLQ